MECRLQNARSPQLHATWTILTKRSSDDTSCQESGFSQQGNHILIEVPLTFFSFPMLHYTCEQMNTLGTSPTTTCSTIQRPRYTHHYHESQYTAHYTPAESSKVCPEPVEGSQKRGRQSEKLKRSILGNDTPLD